MRVGFKLYRQFFKTTINQPATLIIFFAGLVLNVIFIVLIPVFMNFSSITESIRNWEIKTMSGLVGICTMSLFCSVMGEIIANPNDRIFILSRPVRRSVYLTAKLMLSITFASVFAAVISAYYVILNKWCNSQDIVLYNGKMKYEYMIVLSFVLCIFGATCGVSLRFYLREMIVSVIILVVAISYGVSFVFAITQSPTKEPELEYLESLFIPLTLILPLSTSVVGIGYILNQKVNIGI
jgi:hypothetical protein